MVFLTYIHIITTDHTDVTFSFLIPLSVHMTTVNNSLWPSDLLYKSHNAPVTMQYFATEMCTWVHISVTKWYIVGYLSDVLWDFVRWIYWRHRFGSTLTHVMACCLKASIHYLNQLWLIIGRVRHHSPKSNSTWNVHESNHYSVSNNYSFKIKTTSHKEQWEKPQVTTLSREVQLWAVF